jgi:hypothetical protein
MKTVFIFGFLKRPRISWKFTGIRSVVADHSVVLGYYPVSYHPHKNLENFLTSLATVSFSRRAYFHGIDYESCTYSARPLQKAGTPLIDPQT